MAVAREPVADENERLAGLSTTALVCHTRSWGHIWPGPEDGGYEVLERKIFGGRVCEEKSRLECARGCGLVAHDHFEIKPSGKRVRIGKRGYKEDPERPYHPARVETEEDGSPPERLTSADYGYALVARLYRGLRPPKAKRPPGGAKAKRR